jgi:hypothetical protein
MQYRSRATAPASPTASSYADSSMATSTHSASSSSYNGASSSSLIYTSEEDVEDLGDPDVLAHDICDFFGGIPAPKKAKKPKAPKVPKQKPVKVELPVGASTAAQPREGNGAGSRLRRLCKAIVPVSFPSSSSSPSVAHCSTLQTSKA